MRGRNQDIYPQQTISVQWKEREPLLRGLQRQSIRCIGLLSVGRRRPPRTPRRKGFNRSDGNSPPRWRCHGENESRGCIDLTIQAAAKQA